MRQTYRYDAFILNPDADVILFERVQFRIRPLISTEF